MSLSQRHFARNEIEKREETGKGKRKSDERAPDLLRRRNEIANGNAKKAKVMSDEVFICWLCWYEFLYNCKLRLHAM
jgi:hypothetical protein